MNRRAFAHNLAGVALGAAGLKAAAFGNSRVEAPVPQGETPDIRRHMATNHGEGQEVPFKLSVMLWTVFQKLPFEQRLEKVSEAGYKYVELVGAEYRKWSEDDFHRANAKRRELGITFDTTAGLAHGVGNPSEREAFLADLAKELPIMERIECPSIIVMSGNKVEGMAREQQHQSCIEGLKRAVELVQGRNVVLLLENIDPEENPKYYLTSVAEGFKIIEAVNHPQVKFCYDFFHEQISEGNLIEKLEKNIDKVGLVHIADVPGRHEPGTGEINYDNIFRTLGRLKYDRFAAMEFLPTGDAVQSLRTAREMAIRAGQA
jgi:hydroxypyruvate isomerase